MVTSEAGYPLEIDPATTWMSSASSNFVATGRALRRRRGGTGVNGAGRGAGAAEQEPLAEFTYAGFADVQRAHLDKLTSKRISKPAPARIWCWGAMKSSSAIFKALCHDIRYRERLWSC